MRVALATNILPPYRVPVFRALAATPGWKLRVLLSARREFDRDWVVDAPDLDVELVRGPAFRRRIASRGPAAAEQVVTAHVPVGLFAALRRFRPDVVVSAELGARSWIARLYCGLFRVPLVIWSYHSRASATSAGWLRRLLWRALLRGSDAVVGMGVQARETLQGLGVPQERIFDAPNAHDHAAIVIALADRSLADRRRALRAQLACRERLALVVGRLIPVKGIDPLLRAWERMPRETRSSWTLCFVGSGPLRSRIEESMAEHPPGEILHVEAVSPAALVDFYASADLLVFPSLGDTWGLVVNEAFACGVPALCSRFAGCADDLVRPGENGWIFDPVDPADFGTSLYRALECPHLARLGLRARATAECFQPAAMAAGLRRAISYSASRRSTLLSGASVSS